MSVEAGVVQDWKPTPGTVRWMPIAQASCDLGGAADELIQRDGDFDGPGFVRFGGGDVPVGIPTRIAPATLGRPAAMIDGEAVVRGVVAVDVEKNIDAVVGAEIGVVRAEIFA